MLVHVLEADATVYDGTAVVPARDPVEVSSSHRGGAEIYFRSRTGRKISATLRLDRKACADLYHALEAITEEEVVGAPV